MVMAALKSQHGHTKAAAEVLGIERSVLSHHLRKLNLTGEPARLREVYRRRFLFPKF
jgi:DNA-binding NtrC family response regulator